MNEDRSTIIRLITRLTDDLHDRIQAYYSGMLDCPSMKRKYNRDMEVIIEARNFVEKCNVKR